MDLIEQRAADQAVVAIDVADADAEEQPRAKIVHVADPDAMRADRAAPACSR